MPCTTILVGKNATNDRSTLIARTDDGHFDTKKLLVVKPKDQPRVYKSVPATGSGPPPASTPPTWV